ncbi:reverse transcriptase [Tanacetum coccineum]
MMNPTFILSKDRNMFLPNSKSRGSNLTMPFKNKAIIDYSNTSNSNFLRFYFLLYPESDEDENGMICSKIRVLFIAEDGSSVAELGGVKSCIIIAIIYDLGVTVRKRYQYASISLPLTVLLKKNEFQWNPQTQTAFEELKQAMIQSLVLALSNFEEEFVIETDASGFGIGAVLQQNKHPIAYLIQKRGRQAADALSRIERQGELFSLLAGDSNELIDVVVATWFTNPILNEIVEGQKSNTIKTSKYVWQNDQLRRKDKWVVGQDVEPRKKLIDHFHNSAIGGHSGVQATTKILTTYFYWKGLRKIVKE